MMEPTRRNLWTYVPVMLFGVLFLTPLVAVPASGPWTGIRVFVTQTLALALLGLLLVTSTWSSEAFKRFIVTGPYPAVLLLIAWAALSFVLTAPNVEQERGIALVGFMRLFCGAAICFAAAFFCRSSNHLRLASLLLLIGCIAVAVAGLLSFSFTSKEYITAGFGDNQLLGAFLTGLLPLAVVLAVSPATRGRRLIAWVATVLVACALLMTGNRSGWLGGVVGLLVVAMLAHRAGMMRLSGIRGRVRQKRTALLAAGTALVLISSCFVLSGAGTMVLDRARTLTTLSTDGSVALRLQTWRMSAEMLLERPLTGWGIGSFPVKFGEFYERRGGDQRRYPVPSAAQVKREGVGLSSMAHNEYLQLAAELGLIGLALYLAVLIAFFYCGTRALCRLVTGPSRWLLLAMLGAVAAQCTDAFSNPAWRFREVSSLSWLLMGIGMATIRLGFKSCTGDSSRVHRPVSVAWLAVRRASLLAAGASIFVLCISNKTVMAAMGIPLFSVTADPNALFNFEIIAKTGDGNLIEIPQYVSINDVGKVAFVGRVRVNNPINGARELRDNIYIGATGGTYENITVGANNNLIGNPLHTYFYGPLRINNDGSVATVQVKFETNLNSTDRGQNSVDVWWPINGVGPYVPQSIVSARFDQLRFDNVSGNNEGGNDNPPVTGLGRVAFKVQTVSNKFTYLQTNATASGALSDPILIHRGEHPLFPMIADDGQIVIKAGSEFVQVVPRHVELENKNSIRLYDLRNGFELGENNSPSKIDGRDYALAQDFQLFLGSRPGISDDGLIVAFAGILTPEGAARLNARQGPILHLTPGPGIFALITTQRGDRATDRHTNTTDEGRIIVRVAGVSRNGQFDPGEVLDDINKNGVFDPALKEDRGLLSAFVPEQRVTVNNSGTVLYTAIDDSGRGTKGLFTSRLHVYAVTASVDPPVLIARQGDRISGLAGTIQDIEIDDSINNRGEGDVAFWVRMNDPTATDPAQRTPQAIVRARPRAVERPLSTQLPPTTGREFGGYDWKMQVFVTPNDGIVIEDVRLGARYMARKLSIPYINVKVVRGTEVLFPTTRLELLPDGLLNGAASRLIDFQTRIEADKIIVAGTYVIYQIPTRANYLLVTQRYEFRKAAPGDIGAPGWLFQKPMSRFIPVVEYVFVGEQAPARPHNPARAEVEVVQRLHFRPDDPLRIAKSAVTIFFDGAQLKPPDVGTVPLLADPLPREQRFTAVSKGLRGEYDNWHQTVNPSVDEPIPGIVPGCWECVHIHWRWSFLASSFGNSTFGWGEPLIPVLSNQTVEVGASRWDDLHERFGEEHPRDFREIIDGEDLNVDRLTRYEPIMWYAGKNDGKARNHDAFFTHGGHFSTTTQPVDIEGPINATSFLTVSRGGFRYDRATGRYTQVVSVTNTSAETMPGPVSLVLDGLSGNIALDNQSGTTFNVLPLGSPYANLNSAGGKISPGQSLTVVLEFINPTNEGIRYGTTVWVGTGPR